jgi:hypothetical protein
MPELFNFTADTADFLDGWLVPAIQAQPIGLFADIENLPGNVTALKVPLLEVKHPLKTMPKRSQENCEFNKMQSVLSMSEDDMQLFTYNGEWPFCPKQFQNTKYAHYFKGGSVESGDATNSELGRFIADTIVNNVKIGTNLLAFWGSNTTTADDYKVDYNGLFPSMLKIASASPTGKQVKRITITQNTQIAAGVALEKLQEVIAGQREEFRAVNPNDKAIVCNTQFYDAVRKDLIKGTEGSNIYPQSFLSGMYFFVYEGIRVFLDPSITANAQNSGFASINASNDYVYVAALVHTKNFVIRTSIGESDAFDTFYSKDKNLTLSRAEYNFGTYFRDGRYACLLA